MLELLLIPAREAVDESMLQFLQCQCEQIELKSHNYNRKVYRAAFQSASILLEAKA